MSVVYKDLPSYEQLIQMKKFEKHLRVYRDRSEFWKSETDSQVFREGVISSEAKDRGRKLKEAFERGFLDQIVISVQKHEEPVDFSKISTESQAAIRSLVSSVTSEVGRALIGLTVMQLSIKAVMPDQNIRLHKASANTSSFSWVEGVSMRTLDKLFVTPTLRKYNLVRLNADGFMMTRSLAENYPYSSLYKASLRGARSEWLTVVEELEGGVSDPRETLRFLVSLLLNSAREFQEAADRMIKAVEAKGRKLVRRDLVIDLLFKHINHSDYAARLLELAMHSLMQAGEKYGCFENLSLKPLSQMRSANKKHGNVGDIELLDRAEIVEAWDAKFGKTYLREEIEELLEKINAHPGLQLVGFVTDGEISRTEELVARVDDIESLHGVKILFCTFPDWASLILDRCLSSSGMSESNLCVEWVVSYAESLGQKRRDIAPIDEPCHAWVTSFEEVLGDLS